jgi:hypothetical protein
MAYNSSNFKLVSTGVYQYTTQDSIATITAADYFSNFVSTFSGTVGSIILVSDGTFDVVPVPNTVTLIVNSVSGNAGTASVAGDVLPPAKFSTGTTTTTFAAGQLTGAAVVVYTNTQGTPGSIATRTATEMFNDTVNARVGQTYIVRIVNGQGTGVLTVTAGLGVTLTGTATIAINSWREFAVTFTSATALVMQNVGTGTFS